MFFMLLIICRGLVLVLFSVLLVWSVFSSWALFVASIPCVFLSMVMFRVGRICLADVVVFSCWSCLSKGKQGVPGQSARACGRGRRRPDEQGQRKHKRSVT